MIAPRGGGGGQQHVRMWGGEGGGLKYHPIFIEAFVWAFLHAHLLEASFGCMLCTSCIFVMVIELTLATFCFTSVVFHLCSSGPQYKSLATTPDNHALASLLQALRLVIFRSKPQGEA